MIPIPEDVLRRAVDRFLCWKLPEYFCPDRYIGFNRDEALKDKRGWPTGTNLLTANQAMEMFKHCLAGVIEPQHGEECHLKGHEAI